MPGEVTQGNEEVVVNEAQQIEAQIDADFSSGFDDTPTGATSPAKEEPAPKAEESKEAPPTEAAPPAEPEYRQVTKAEWEDLMAKAATIDQMRADYPRKLDTAFGKVGGLERKIAELQAATPAGYAVDVTDDIVAEMAAEFPELAKGTLSAFKAFAGKLKGTAPAHAAAAAVDPAQIAGMVKGQIAAEQEALIEDEHPQFRALIGAPGSDSPYRQWLAKQSAEEQQRLSSTYSAAVISRSITRFKEAQAAEQAAAEAKRKADESAAQASRDRQGRFAAAATPKGAGGHAPGPTEDDEFQQGFKS